MPNKKDTTIIFINLKYLIYSFIVAGLIFLMFAVLGVIMWGVNSVGEWLGLIGLIILAFTCFYMAISNYQTAELNNNGIIIKSLFKKYCNINWKDIENVSVKFVPSLSNNLGVYWKYNWIFISTGNDIPEKRYREISNRKNKSPYVILYHPHRAKILAKYLKEYRPEIDLTELLSEYSTKTKAKWGHW